MQRGRVAIELLRELWRVVERGARVFADEPGRVEDEALALRGVMAHGGIDTISKRAAFHHRVWVGRDVQLLLLALHGEARKREVMLAADEAAEPSGLSCVEDAQPAAVALAPYEPLGTRWLQLASRPKELAVRAEESCEL